MPPSTAAASRWRPQKGTHRFMGNRSDYQAPYTNLTPMVRSERHLTSHDLLMVSGLMMRMNWSGIPMGLAISSKAPVSDRLRIVQSTRPRSKEIVPPLNVRCLELSRFSSIAGVLRCAAELDKGKSHKNQNRAAPHSNPAARGSK